MSCKIYLYYKPVLLKIVQEVLHDYFQLLQLGQHPMGAQMFGVQSARFKRLAQAIQR